MIPHRLENHLGERLATSFTPGAPGDDALVVIGHGLTSDKDRPWSETLSSRFAEAGVASLRFAFAGNGDSEGEFLASSIAKEVLELRRVLELVGDRPIAYVGHSMGGAVGLLTAAQDARIDVLVSLAAITDAREFVERMFGDLEEGAPMLGKPQCPFGRVLETNLRDLGSIEAHGAAIGVPWLAVHGTADDMVPAWNTERLFAANRVRLQVAWLDGVDHSFSGDGLHQLADVVVPWVTDRLSVVRAAANPSS